MTLIKKNHVILSLKVIFITTSFVFIFSKIDTDKTLEYIKNISPLSFIAAYLLLTFAQVISAFRTRFYFASAGLNFAPKFAVASYFVGMFLNNILPGGIGGDAYKVFLFNKLSGLPKLKSIQLLLSDRASGLFILMLLFFIFAFFSNLMRTLPYPYLLLTAGLIITIPCYFFAVKTLLKEHQETAITASFYSFFVQILGILIVIIIVTSLSETSSITTINSYICLFLASSVLAVLPITIGGVGVRELTLMYGSTFLGLDPELGVAIAIIFFVITFTCSLNGLFFWHRLEKIYK